MPKVRLTLAATAAAAAGLGLTGVATAATDGGTTVRVSVTNPGGNNPDGDSTRPAISKDGFYQSFQSAAKNLVPGDGRTHGLDVFAVDRRNPAGTLVRVSTSSTGGDANGDSHFSSLSNSGEEVAFDTLATNIRPGGNRSGAIFVRWLKSMNGRAAGTVEEIDVTPAGASGNGSSGRPSISADGRYVTFNSTASDLLGVRRGGSNIFVRDLVTNTTKLVSNGASGAGGGASFRPIISSDGNEITWQSNASNYGPTDTNGVPDAYASANPFLVSNPPVQLVSANLAGTDAGNAASQRPFVSGNGRYVGFQSSATNLTGDAVKAGILNIYVRDLTTNRTTLISKRYDGTLTSASTDRITLNYDGSVAGFVSNDHAIVPRDRDGTRDVFTRTWQAATPVNTEVSVAYDGGSTACPAPPSAAAAATTTIYRPGADDINTRPYLSGDASVVVFVSSLCRLTPTATNDGTRNDAYVRVYPPATP